MTGRSSVVQDRLERLYVACRDMDYDYSKAWIDADHSHSHPVIRPLMVATGQLLQSVLDNTPPAAALDAVLAAARGIRPASRQVLIDTVFAPDMPDNPELLTIYERLAALLAALNHDRVR